MSNEQVTVAIIAYNSSGTIVRTLDSIVRQSYDNIELIVSDDASDDNTVEVVNKWMVKNRMRFTDCQILCAKKNQGISYNVQKAVYGATSKWIKLLAADDYLRPNAIMDYMSSLKKGIYVYEANMIRVDNNGRFLDDAYLEKWRIRRLAKHNNPKMQFNEWVKRDVCLSPTIFFNVEKYKKMGGSDHFEPLIDDWTLILKFLRNGYCVGYIDKYTVVYMKHESVSHTNKEFLSGPHIARARKVKRKLCYPYISKKRRIYWIGERALRYAEDLTIHKFKNKKSVLSISIYLFFSIFQYQNWEKLFIKIIKNPETKNAKRMWQTEKSLYGFGENGT